MYNDSNPVLNAFLLDLFMITEPYFKTILEA